ncbi:alkaline phosphatase PhoX [Caldimonas brevitalea]|uniref:Translocation protein TolB n=1 Tax=Caldimonas brevitalea TaxID=413882 RepID=A0A0G3BNR8_9BURK|nr:alkaline phosphatase PhoX [Caldimonas brevitalea]AKJ28996.1 translocation protein TolB [Caldimonas brevitalea]
MSDLFETPSHDRRAFLRTSLLTGGLLAIGSPTAWASGLPAVPANPRVDGQLLRIVGAGGFGELLPPNADGLRLPAGFTSRVIARTGLRVGSTSYVWHGAPDGGATFPSTDGGWIYVSNSERALGAGGVSAIDFDATGAIRKAYRICSHTNRNCAGGPTPWGTWLTCEETDRGRVYECDPTGERPAVARDALGWFDHEAVTVDTTTGYLYLTEDKADGRLYRFRPTQPGRLDAGTLEVARRVGTGAPYALQWLPVPSPNPRTFGLRTRRQVPDSSAFNGGEGIWYHQGTVYFTTKGDNRVWALHTASDRLDIVYDAATAADPVLSGVDNLVVSRRGEVYVAEDGGSMQVVVIAPDGKVAPLLKVEGQDDSEITGPAFSPDGSRLYFSSQRGSFGFGITYEVSGPFMSM